MEPTPKTADTGPSDAFIRHVAHDLRASLNAVVGWAELVKAGPLSPEDLVRAGETILRHSRQLSQRLGDALDLWRLDVGLLQVSPRPASMVAAVRSALDLAKPMFDSRRVDCVFDMQTDGFARIDGARVSQALATLLGDAAINTPAGDRVVVRTAIEDDDLVVRVVGGGRLPGPGAFERTVHDTRADIGARPFDFGLSLARTLVVLQGGTLTAEAAESDRVAFVLRLPMVDRPQAATPPTRPHATGDE